MEHYVNSFMRRSQKKQVLGEVGVVKEEARGRHGEGKSN